MYIHIYSLCQCCILPWCCFLWNIYIFTYIYKHYGNIKQRRISPISSIHNGYPTKDAQISSRSSHSSSPPSFSLLPSPRASGSQPPIMQYWSFNSPKQLAQRHHIPTDFHIHPRLIQPNAKPPPLLIRIQNLLKVAWSDDIKILQK